MTKRPDNLHDILISNFKGLGWQPLWAYVFFLTGLTWYESRWGSFLNLLLFPGTFVLWVVLDLIVLGVKWLREKRKARKAAKAQARHDANVEYARLAEASAGTHPVKKCLPCENIKGDEKARQEGVLRAWQDDIDAKQKDTDIRSDWQKGHDEGFEAGRADFANEIHPRIKEIRRRLDNAVENTVLIPKSDWDDFAHIVGNDWSILMKATAAHTLFNKVESR